MYLGLISKYRTPLMGIAILWVMLFHSTLNSFPLHMINQIKHMGYMGVDIFMFLSGFGIYNSLKKNSDIKTFYKKRVLRILPYYLPIVLIYSILLYYNKAIPFDTVILNFFTISYWMGLSSFDWYIPTILLFYFLTPFYLKLFDKSVTITLALSYALSALLFILLINSKYVYLYIALARFPIYVSGIWFGYYCKKKGNMKLSTYYTILFVVFVIIGFILWNKFFLYLGNTPEWNNAGISLIPNLVMSIPLTFLLSYILSIFKNYKYPILTFFGTYTLTLYIFHERVTEIVKLYDISMLQSSILIFIITIILAVLWQKAVDWVIKRYF